MRRQCTPGTRTPGDGRIWLAARAARSWRNTAGLGYLCQLRGAAGVGPWSISARSTRQCWGAIRKGRSDGGHCGHSLVWKQQGQEDHTFPWVFHAGSAGSPQIRDGRRKWQGICIAHVVLPCGWERQGGSAGLGKTLSIPHALPWTTGVRPSEQPSSASQVELGHLFVLKSRLPPCCRSVVGLQGRWLTRGR